MAPAAPKARLVPWWTRPLAYALLQTDGTDKGAKVASLSRPVRRRRPRTD